MPDSYGICKLTQPCGAVVSNTKDNPPCNTLFIGNLGDSVSEAELRSVFSILPGFQQIKLGKNNRNISCFVEFRDLASAMGCHQSQQVGQGCWERGMSVSSRAWSSWVHCDVHAVLA